MAPHALTLETADLLASGEVKISHIGGLFSYQLHRDDWPAYREAKLNGFVMLPRSDGRARRLGRVWLAYCEARKWPVIKIMPRVTFAAIESDQVLLDYRQVSDAALEPLRPLLAEHCVGGWHQVNDSFIYASRVPIPIAPFVASRIVDLFWAMLKLPERMKE